MAAGDDIITESFWTRLKHGVRSCFSTQARYKTANEYALEGELAYVRSEVVRKDQHIASLQLEIALATSSLKIAHLEVHDLMGVVFRDRKRVEAETARYRRDSEEPPIPER